MDHPYLRMACIDCTKRIAVQCALKSIRALLAFAQLKHTCRIIHLVTHRSSFFVCRMTTKTHVSYSDVDTSLKRMICRHRSCQRVQDISIDVSQLSSFITVWILAQGIILVGTLTCSNTWDIDTVASRFVPKLVGRTVEVVSNSCGRLRCVVSHTSAWTWNRRPERSTAPRNSTTRVACWKQSLDALPCNPCLRAERATASVNI